jgi:antitoxin CptB
MAGEGVVDADDAELRRLRWRCRRGMRELDQLLVRWLDRRWRQSPTGERDLFLTLLDTEDDRLWRWFLGHEVVPDAALASLVERIRTLPP